MNKSRKEWKDQLEKRGWRSTGCTKIFPAVIAVCILFMLSYTIIDLAATGDTVLPSRSGSGPEVSLKDGFGDLPILLFFWGIFLFNSSFCLVIFYRMFYMFYRSFMIPLAVLKKEYPNFMRNRDHLDIRSNEEVINRVLGKVAKDMEDGGHVVVQSKNLKKTAIKDLNVRLNKMKGALPSGQVNNAVVVIQLERSNYFKKFEWDDMILASDIIEEILMEEFEAKDYKL